MDRLLRTVLSVNEAKKRHDDDFVDRLTRTYTCSILVLFATIVSTKQFVGEPIACWCPAHFTESHRSYTNNVCWVSNTFYVPFEHRIPGDSEESWKERQMVSYYQWIPLILLSQAVMSFVPALIWRFLNIRSGIDMSALMDAAVVCQRGSYAEIREKTIRYIVNQIDRYLLAQRDFQRGCCTEVKQIMARYCFMVGGKRHGNYLMVTYLFVKVLYLCNAVGQLFLLDYFLGIEYHMYGIHVAARLLKGEDWTVSERFPRVTLCNFQIRHQSRVHDYVVQCALTINLFNEKIFIIVWFWLVFVALISALNALQWFARALYWPGQLHYVKKKLRAYEVTHRSKGNLKKFVNYYLRRDGLFLIRMISINIGEMVAAETLAGLWENYGPDRRHMTEDPTRSRRSVTNAASLAGATTGTTRLEVV